MQLLMFFAVFYFLSSLHSHIHALIFFSVLFIVLFMRLEFLNLYIKKFSFFIYGCPTFLPITRAPDVRFASKTHHCNPLEPLHNYAKQNNTWKFLCRSQLLFIVCPTPHALYPDFFGRKARVPFLRPKTSCIAKKGPSPRYARKSKFPLYSSIHFPSSHPPVMATLGRVVFPASAPSFLLVGSIPTRFFSHSVDS